MKTLATITLALVVIVASLVLASSSMCAVSAGLNTGVRETYAVIAVVALAVIIAGVAGILRLRRRPGGE
jgi:hypothetical protein